MSAGLCSLQSLQRKGWSFLAFSSFWKPQTFCALKAAVTSVSASVFGGSSSHSVSLFLHKNTSSVALSAYWTPAWSYGNWNLQWPYFQVRSHSEALGVRSSTYELGVRGAHHPAHNSILNSSWDGWGNWPGDRRDLEVTHLSSGA